MISSEQVAALMEAQQRRSTMLQATYAGGYMPQGGTSQYPPSFSYAPQNPTAGARTAAFAGSAIQAVPGAITTASAAAGVASMFGVQNMAVRAMTSPFFDPFGYGIAQGARAAGGALMGGQGVAAAGAAGFSAAAPMMAAGAVGAGALYGGARLIGQGFQDYSGMQGAMSRYQFANAGAPGMRGFSTQDMSSIMRTMRGTDANDPFTSFGDTQRMLQGFNDMGMGQNVRDAQEVSSRLKKMMQAVKDIARTTGSTLDDAMSNYSQMRQSGFFSNRDVVGNASNMRMAEGMGISRGAFLGAQQAGSSTYRHMAMSGRSGALQATGTAESLLTMMGLGGTSSDKIMDVFGSEDAAGGALEFGRQASGGLGNFLRNSGQGNALMLAGGEMKDGVFTGRMNKDFMDKVSRGELGLQDMSRIAASRPRDRKAMLSYKDNSSRIAGDLLQRDDSMVAVVEMIRQSTKNNGGDQAAQQLIQTYLGVNEEVAKMMMDITKNWTKISSEKQSKILEEARTAREQVRLRQNYTAGGIAQRLSGNISDIFAPVRQAGADMSASIQQGMTDLSNSVMGIDPRTGVGASQVSRGLAMAMQGKAVSPIDGTSVSAGRLSDQFAKSVAMRTGVAGDGTFDADLHGLTADQRGALDAYIAKNRGAMTKTLDRALLTGQGNFWEDQIGTKLSSVLGDVGDARALAPYAMSQMGDSGRALAAQALQRRPGANALYGAGDTMETLTSKMTSKYSGWFGTGIAKGDFQQLQNSSTAQDLLTAVSAAGKNAFGGGDMGDAYTQEVLRLQRMGVSPADAKEAARSSLNKKFGVSAGMEDYEAVSRIAQGMSADEFGNVAYGVSQASGQRGLQAAFDSVLRGGFGGLERSPTLAKGLQDFATGALLSGDGTASYAKLLGGNDDLSGLSADDPFVTKFRRQREAYRGFAGKESVSEEDLAKSLGWGVSDLDSKLGRPFQNMRSGGITGEEAQKLFAQGAGLNLLGDAAAGGTGVSLRSNDVTAASDVQQAMEQTVEVQQGMLRVLTNLDTSTSATKDELLKIRGTPNPAVDSTARPAGNSTD